MKQLVSFALLLIAAGFFFSCRKSFLDVPVQGQPTPQTDPSLAQNLVVGVYNSLLNGEAFGGNDIHGFGFISATNILSDDADKGSTPDDQASTAGQLDNFTTTPSNVFVSSLWSGYYNGIARCNQALNALSSAALDSTSRNQLIAEVRFIRAYYYFNLVRFFGAVPKVVRVAVNAQDANNDTVFQSRAPVDTIYNSVIVPDLQFGVAHLPLRNLGHATKGAAQTLLAKVNLYRRNWQQVLDLTGAVISSGQYALVPDYSTIWRQVGDNSVESIFEVQTGQFNNTDFGVQLYSGCQGPRVGGRGGWADLGWGFCTPTVNLINAYEPGDKRKAATIIFIDNSGAHTGTVLFDGFRIPSADSVQNLYYNYKAYHSENKTVETYSGNRDFKQKNIHLLRYAEVLLMHAEAANELNQTGVAIQDLDMVRRRAGLPNTTAASQSAVRDAIWKERRVELAMEHDRFWDLVRQGRAAQVMQAAGKPFVAGKHELLPIPDVQILLSGNRLKQNPGY